MNHLITELRKHQKHLTRIQQDIQNALNQTKIQGTLVFRHRGKHLELSQNLGAGLPQQYVSLSNTDILSPLAQKRYYKEVLTTISAKLQAIDRCIKVLRKEEVLLDLRKVYEAFPRQLKALIKPIEQLDDTYAKQWQKTNYATMGRQVNTNLRTKKGEFVRSKSELIIANKLYDAGLPYHYETLFMKDQFIAYPDFYILNPRTRKEFYWEHFGLMSRQDYLNDSLHKIEEYSKWGIIQGDNLIVTYESAEHQLNTDYVDKLIRTFLISG